MACLGVEPRVAGWKGQTNPLSYGGTPIIKKCLQLANPTMAATSEETN